jgi:hypothetical protein
MTKSQFVRDNYTHLYIRLLAQPGANWSGTRPSSLQKLSKVVIAVLTEAYDTIELMSTTEYTANPYRPDMSDDKEDDFDE